MGDKEEGEVSEEGELPEEGEDNQPVPEAVEQADASDAPSAPAQATGTVATQPQEPEQQLQPAGPTSTGEPAPAASAAPPAVAEAQQQQQGPSPGLGAERGREPGSRDQRAAEGEGRQQHDSSRHRSADREKTELLQELDRLTADLTFQEIRTNWGAACPNIKTAIKKLDKLLRRVKRKREDAVELYPPCHEFAGRILAALKHVTVITSTGLGKTVDMELGHNIMKTAVNYRHDVFSAAQKKELEAAIRESKEFQYLFTDRERGKPKTGGGGSSKSPGAAGQTQQDEQQQQQRVPLARGDKGQRQQQQPQQLSRPRELQRSDRSTASASPKSKSSTAAAAGGQVPGVGSVRASSPAAAAAAAAAPPPPSAPRRSSSREPAQAAAAAEQQQQQQQVLPAGGKPAPAAAATVARSSSIKIVINSTMVGAGAGAAAGDSGWQQQQQDSPDIAGAAAAAAAEGSGGRDHPSGLTGVKRGAVEIRDLLDDDSDDVDDPMGLEQQLGTEQQAAKRTKLEHAGANGDSAQQQQEQQQQVAPWESEDHQRAVDSSTPLQGVMSRLLESRRLVLVLDLDHTLVNSVKFNEVDAEWEYRLEQTVAEQLSRPRDQQDLHRLVRMGMWTKLRPGVRDFLRRAAERFELWIYTAGSRTYADAMAELLDPDGRYFGGRIIAQGVPEVGEDGAPQPLVFKRLLQGLEGCEPVVLIVDDSSAVWPNDRRNLFVVERYIYFPSSRKRLGMAGKSLMEVNRDECPQRGMLMTALRVFEALHAAVFSRLPQAPLSLDPEAAAVWDVRNVLASEKRRVLAGVQLVFSRVIPLETNPRQHPLWVLAEQYGASCSQQCTPDTTHVVASNQGTEKVMWAHQHNKKVVSPAWLECSCIVWQKAVEERFAPPHVQ